MADSSERIDALKAELAERKAVEDPAALVEAIGSKKKRSVLRRPGK